MKELVFVLKKNLQNAVYFLSQKLNFILSFLKLHYTPLAIIIFMLSGIVIFYETAYFFRFNYWDYWNWKKRAQRKIVIWIVILFAIKLVII